MTGKLPDAAGNDGRVTSIGTGRPSVVVERHSVVADPGPRDHVASADCWCDPIVEVVHRVAPAPSTIPDHRVIDLNERRTRGEL